MNQVDSDLSSERLDYQIESSLCSTVPREGGRAFSAAGPQLASQLLVRRDLGYHSREVRRIERIEIKAPIPTHLGQRCRARNQCWATTGHRFKWRQSKSFIERGVDEAH